MKNIDRNVLQADIKIAIQTVNDYKSMKDPAKKAAFLSGYLGRKYPEISSLLSYIAEIDSTPA